MINKTFRLPKALIEDYTKLTILRRELWETATYLLEQVVGEDNANYPILHQGNALESDLKGFTSFSVCYFDNYDYTIDEIIDRKSFCILAKELASHFVNKLQNKIPLLEAIRIEKEILTRADRLVERSKETGYSRCSLRFYIFDEYGIAKQDLNYFESISK